MICHVERSRDISNYSCSKSQRFLDSARNDRWKTVPPETTAATTTIHLSSSSPRAARQMVGREAPITFARIPRSKLTERFNLTGIHLNISKTHSLLGTRFGSKLRPKYSDQLYRPRLKHRQSI